MPTRIGDYSITLQSKHQYLYVDDTNNPTLDQEVGALTKGFIALYLGGRDSTISMSSLKTSTKCFESNISLNSLQSILETKIKVPTQPIT